MSASGARSGCERRRGGALARLLDRRGMADRERGGVLVLVVGAISVLTAFALVALMAAVTAAPLSRRAQDERTATAAAQAGFDDYLSRLVANPSYYTTSGSGVDAANPAFGAGGAPAPGSGGARFRYELLTTPQQTVQDGVIRLRATGTSRGVSRSLTASLKQSGFLDYVYFSDLEVVDPALIRVSRVDTHVAGVGWGNSYGDFSPDPVTYADRCGRYLYAGRHSYWDSGASISTYTSSATTPYYERDGSGARVPSTDYGRVVSFACSPISFGGGDVIDGPLHTNDAIRIVGGGGVTFTSPATETGWADGSTPAPPSGSRWWGPGSPSVAGYKPVHAPVLQMPGSNGDLRARIVSEGTAAGCTYTGQTRIRFAGASMKVLSPQTTASTPGCFDAAQRETEQTISPVPGLVYVDDLPGTCSSSTGIGFPLTGEAARGATRISYGCANGTAFVQGSLSGQATVAAARDVVVTGDLTYAGGTSGTDVLGLIPNGFVWVYNPQTSSDVRLLSQPVGSIDAGILSLGHSFVVQNYDRGGDLGTLLVRGTIAQKHRGIVRSNGNGYVKDYRFDQRLANLPPPYFLSPADSPWTVTRVSDG